MRDPAMQLTSNIMLFGIFLVLASSVVITIWYIKTQGKPHYGLLSYAAQIVMALAIAYASFQAAAVGDYAPSGRFVNWLVGVGYQYVVHVFAAVAIETAVQELTHFALPLSAEVSKFGYAAAYLSRGWISALAVIIFLVSFTYIPRELILSAFFVAAPLNYISDVFKYLHRQS
jgi:hypothetical protein